MNSYIFIDGPVLWFVIAMIIIFMFFGILMSLINASIQKECDKVKRENAYLKRKLSHMQEKQYKENYKTYLKSTEVGNG